VSLFDVALHQLNYSATWALNTDQVPTRLERSSTSRRAGADVSEADGWVFIMC